MSTQTGAMTERNYIAIPVLAQKTKHVPSQGGERGGGKYKSFPFLSQGKGRGPAPVRRTKRKVTCSSHRTQYCQEEGRTQSYILTPSLRKKEGKQTTGVGTYAMEMEMMLFQMFGRRRGKKGAGNYIDSLNKERRGD